MSDERIEAALLAGFERATKPASAGGLMLCSPLHRCFPPRPTVCLICRSESTDNCVLREAAS